MNNQRIHLCLAHMGGHEQRYIQEAFDTNWVVPLGPNVDGFEQDLELFLHQENCHVAALLSGTAALHLAFVLLGVERGDEVICQSFTFTASANPVVYQGGIPVFVDSEPHTWNISPTLLEEAIRDRIRKTGRRPKAIVATHLYGMPFMMKEIQEVASRYEIPIVEDAAEAMGSCYNGRPCATFGTYGILSFNGNKMITTSGGGALICPSAAEKKRAVFYATQAREPAPYYQHEHIGYNYRLSNISAGIGRGQMHIVHEHIAHHRHLVTRYAEQLADCDVLTLHTNPSEKFDSNYWLATVTIDTHRTQADVEMIRQHLERCGIESRLLWKPLHLQPVFSGTPAYTNGVSENLFACGLCLPTGPCVSDEDVVRITHELKRCVKN